MSQRLVPFDFNDLPPDLCPLAKQALEGYEAGDSTALTVFSDLIQERGLTPPIFYGAEKHRKKVTLAFEKLTPIERALGWAKNEFYPWYLKRKGIWDIEVVDVKIEPSKSRPHEQLLVGTYVLTRPPPNVRPDKLYAYTQRLTRENALYWMQDGFVRQALDWEYAGNVLYDTESEVLWRLPVKFTIRLNRAKRLNAVRIMPKVSRKLGVPYFMALFYEKEGPTGRLVWASGRG